jgi:hypothetical protein
MRKFNLLKTQLTFLQALMVFGIALLIRLPRETWLDRGATCETPSLIKVSASGQVAADFDGDHWLDRAELFSDGFNKNIRLGFSGAWMMTLSFFADTRQPGILQVEDIDRDSDEDLVWVSDPQLTRVALWLNNGAGEMSRVAEPAAYSDEIRRLVGDVIRNLYAVASARAYPKAAAASGFSVTAQADDSLPEPPRAAFSRGACHDLAGLLPSCVTRYPKRGPPPTHS